MVIAWLRFVTPEYEDIAIEILHVELADARLPVNGEGRSRYPRAAFLQVPV